MAQPIDLTSSALVALSRASLAALRAALLRDAGPAAAAYLQEAGFAGGPAVYETFRDWLAIRRQTTPDALAVEDFERHASEFFRETGWGTLHLGALGEGVARLESPDWGEADPASALEHPGCHLSTGMFADFFGRMADAPLAVMEVECRSAGASRCVFLMGSAETMQMVYEGMANGQTYEDAVRALQASSAS